MRTIDATFKKRMESRQCTVATTTTTTKLNKINKMIQDDKNTDFS